MENNRLIEVEMQYEEMYTLRVLSKNTLQLADEIAALLEGDNEDLHHAPVILEIDNVHFQASELAVLMEILTQNQILAVGIRTDVQALVDFAKFAGLAVFGKPAVALKKTKEFSGYQHKIHRAPKIVVNSVPAFEQIVSEDSDLVLLNSIAADADIIAHGSVSAYREMKGKVFAGINGDKKSTIFIHSFDAQLISIAGIYKRFDAVPDKLRFQTVVVDLKDEQLRFKTI